MTHFAKIENGIVTQVIVAEQDVIDSGIFGEGWVKTSYNTHNNVHVNGKTPLRGNFAAISYIYDLVNDVFYPPQPYPSWILNENLWKWEAPVSYPQDNNLYQWDEPTISWVLVNRL